MKVNVKEARERFSAIVHQVEAGTEIVLTRRGKEVARMIPPVKKTRRLPRIKDFRDSIGISSKTLSEVVMEGRKEERF
jgi:prevent-host-death family protein